MNVTAHVNQARSENEASSGQTGALRVLVTGGAGFVGSHLCRRLLAEGHVVLCLDNLLSGQMSNIHDLAAHDRFSFSRHDVIDPISVEGPLDRIYNLACPASPPIYQRDPIHTFQTCITGATNVLTLARQKGARVLQASTSEVYGDPMISPQSETYWGNVNTFGPRACYDEGKRGAETLCHDFHAQHGVDVRIPRIFNTYGPNMSPEDGRVISNFVVQALNDLDVTVMGDGTQTRSFCYIDDLVDGLLHFMEHPRPHPTPVNFGRPEEYTVLEIAQKVLELTRSKSKIRFIDLPVDDPRQRKPDISVAQSLLGWVPHTSLEHGLNRTVRYFQATNDRSDARLETTQARML